MNNGVEVKSFSVQRGYVDAKVPESGAEVFQLLSAGQKKLLEDSKVAIDWSRVRACRGDPIDELEDER